MKKFTWRSKPIVLLLILALGGLWVYRVAVKEFVSRLFRPSLPVAKEYAPQNFDFTLGEKVIASGEQIEVTKDRPLIVNYELPAKYNLAVPFQPQAPNADWNMPYQEACEEASLIMADAFFNKTSLSVGEMDERIKTLVDWQNKKFGYYEDTTAAEVAIIAKEYFGLQAEIDSDVSVENIKKYLNENKLVLVPAAGKILPNPNFKNGGPLYHMLVIRGYTADKFITNDPGTRKGKEFVYKYNDLLNAIHDWPLPTGGSKADVNEAKILAGKKVLIVVSK